LNELLFLFERGNDPAIMLIFATNDPKGLDSAVVSRFPDIIYIGPPNAEARRGILRYWLNKALVLRGVHLSAGEQPKELLESLVVLTKGWVGRDLAQATLKLFQVTLLSKGVRHYTKAEAIKVFRDYYKHRNILDRSYLRESKKKRKLDDLTDTPNQQRKTSQDNAPRPPSQTAPAPTSEERPSKKMRTTSPSQAKPKGATAQKNGVEPAAKRKKLAAAAG
jgi:SpoVK/Ycf46/Vps4 family AAA+-type ATPase